MKNLHGFSAAICRLRVSVEQQKILAVINRLSEVEDEEFARVRMIQTYEILGALHEAESELASLDEDDLYSHLVDMKHRRLIFCEDGDYPDEVRAAFLGMVWERRRENFNGAEEIDRLVDEWETASVDFKREFFLNTGSEKAEFVKDVIGLVNTKTSGRRWLIVGFADKSRQVYIPTEARAGGEWFNKTDPVSI